MQYLFILLLTFSTFFISSVDVLGFTKRALVIGINQYETPEGETAVSNGRKWANLDGTINDAVGIRDVIRSRYGFKDDNITLLIERDNTTRDAIFDALSELVDISEKGDVVFIYYAGHGSQVKNSLSPEFDKLDETLVPSDSYRGAMDVRDKELNRLFQHLVRNGVHLTVIFDSCNSGSGTRSDLNIHAPKTRALAPLLSVDVMDATEDEDNTVLVEKGALFMSASQDYQLAREYTDSEGKKHGAFTFCLLKAMNASSPNESAINIFKKAKSIMLYNDVPKQNPSIEGSQERKESPLFGGIDKDASKETTISVFKKESKLKVHLDGGYVTGVREGAKLVQLDKEGQKTEVRLQITEMPSINKCIAKVIEGNYNSIRVGDLFKLDGWVEDEKNVIQIWYPQDVYTREAIVNIQKEIEGYCKNLNIERVKSPKQDTPDNIMLLNKGKWLIRDACGNTVELDKNLDEKAFAEQWNALKSNGCKEAKDKLFIYLPVESEVKDMVNLGLSATINSMKLLTTPDNAQYILTGMMDENNQLNYSWINVNYKERAPFPASSQMVSTEKDIKVITRTLFADIEKISRIRGWLTLESPSNEESFPYKLAIKNAETKEILSEGDSVFKDDVYGFVLVKDKNLFAEWTRQHRFLYVFGIDNNGNMKLFYPLYGSIENNTRTLAYQNKMFLDEVKLGLERAFQITPPYGVDTFLLLSSVDPLDEPELLEDFQQMRSAETDNPLIKLFQTSVGGQSRGAQVLTTPVNWQLQRVSVVSFGE